MKKLLFFLALITTHLFATKGESCEGRLNGPFGKSLQQSIDDEEQRKKSSHNNAQLKLEHEYPEIAQLCSKKLKKVAYATVCKLFKAHREFDYEFLFQEKIDETSFDFDEETHEYFPYPADITDYIEYLPLSEQTKRKNTFKKMHAAYALRNYSSLCACVIKDPRNAFDWESHEIGVAENAVTISMKTNCIDALRALIAINAPLTNTTFYSSGGYRETALIYGLKHHPFLKKIISEFLESIKAQKERDEYLLQQTDTFRYGTKETSALHAAVNSYNASAVKILLNTISPEQKHTFLSLKSIDFGKEEDAAGSTALEMAHKNHLQLLTEKTAQDHHTALAKSPTPEQKTSEEIYNKQLEKGIKACSKIINLLTEKT